MEKRIYGWKRPLPDYRDHMYSSVEKIHSLAVLPPKVDLRPGMPPVYDQGDLGSCTANAVGGAFEYNQKRYGKEDYVPSRLFIYYNERVMDGSPLREDTGSSLSTGVKVLNKLGAPHEKLWWYDTKKFATKPSKAVYDDGLKHTISQYLNIDNTNIAEIKTALSKNNPVVFGFTVYDSFQSDAVARTGMMPMPKKTERILGGHAVMMVGYDDSQKVFIVRNSWGAGWGDKGYFYMPYAYATNLKLADDFWTIVL